MTHCSIIHIHMWTPRCRERTRDDYVSSFGIQFSTRERFFIKWKGHSRGIGGEGSKNNTLLMCVSANTRLCTVLNVFGEIKKHDNNELTNVGVDSAVWGQGVPWDSGGYSFRGRLPHCGRRAWS